MQQLAGNIIYRNRQHRQLHINRQPFFTCYQQFFILMSRNRCVKQENIFSCDSCLQQSMQRSLDGKFANWEKISTGRYYTGFPYNTVMEQLIINDQYVVRFSRQKKKDAKYAVAE